MPVLPTTFAETGTHISDAYDAILPPPLSHSAIKLDSFALSGFFGGGRSVVGMAALKLIPGHRWCGWYNTPGSIEMAKQYGPLAHLKLLDALFPEGEANPTRLFKLDVKKGPQFVAIHSTTTLKSTGHLAHLITRKAEETDLTYDHFPGRATTSPSIAIVNLGHRGELGEPGKHPPLPRSWETWFTFAPMLVSVGACVMCALVGDWFSFVSIVVGIVAHGVACYAIGSGKLTLQHPEPAPKARRGDGVLKGGKTLVVFVGDERAVNVFTRGCFRLQYGAGASDKKLNRFDDPLSAKNNIHANIISPSSAKQASSVNHSVRNIHPSFNTKSPPRYLSRYIRRICQPFLNPPQSLIGYSALLLMGQFIIQLLLVPLGTLFGQLMFVATVIASWMYNAHLSSLNREGIQTRILMNAAELKDIDIRKYQLSTWTATVAFACFVLASEHPLDDPLHFLNAMVPKNTVAWKEWKRNMGEKLKDRRYFDLGANCKKIKFSKRDWEVADGKNRGLLETLFHDAEDAWAAWSRVRHSPSLLKPGATWV
ncbi:hypothetical protein GSI_12219 [Ganoderma sinense ZZ0214-1]|uniref:Uncharacterized protein n=1 Tax=Ganoderma sinense ZZ0214-1 TaxID=1077348 RepID=A0A2G8RY67_9APHY|nr:hypothetical protein GSI_12219 [Ganoderma sinense ZZ0214-1]